MVIKKYHLYLPKINLTLNALFTLLTINEVVIFDQKFLKIPENLKNCNSI